MKHCVKIPVGKSLQFPDLCPFTETSTPRGVVRLKKSKTLFVIPLPGGIFNRYKNARIQIPACQQVATKAVKLEILMWASLLGGIVFGFLMVKATGHSPTPQFSPLLPLIVGPILALVFRILRHIVLRKVTIGRSNAEVLELNFQSETYARKFSELNHFPVTVDRHTGE